ncbi:MAG: hypothetical protein GWP14_00910 [Actinobacteria bacterium]|nr:hypothetical protein [Actinomycetota bacterium]
MRREARRIHHEEHEGKKKETERKRFQNSRFEISDSKKRKPGFLLPVFMGTSFAGMTTKRKQ